jgi:hypothetical protein
MWWPDLEFLVVDNTYLVVLAESFGILSFKI